MVLCRPPPWIRIAWHFASGSSYNIKLWYVHINSLCVYNDMQHTRSRPTYKVYNILFVCNCVAYIVGMARRQEWLVWERGEGDNKLLLYTVNYYRYS